MRDVRKFDRTTMDFATFGVVRTKIATESKFAVKLQVAEVLADHRRKVVNNLTSHQFYIVRISGDFT